MDADLEAGQGVWAQGGPSLACVVQLQSSAAQGMKAIICRPSGIIETTGSYFWGVG